MRVDHCAHQAVQGERQPCKNARCEIPRRCHAASIHLFDAGVKPEIFDRLFLRPPGQLESPQALVFKRCSTEMQCLKAVLRQKLDGFPHDQIVPPKVLVPLVGGSELVNGLFPLMEEDRCSDRSRPLACEDNKAQSGLDDLS